MNDVQVLSGFRYTIEPGEIHEAGKADPAKVVRMTFHDDERGIDFQTWWPAEAWEEFRRDVNGGVEVASPEAIRRLGV